MLNAFHGIILKTAAVLAAIATAALAPAHADDAAEDFIAGVLAEAEPILELDDEKAFFDGIERLVDKHVDMRRVGYFVLGQYARRMSDAQKEEYFPLFEEYATRVYQNTLQDYAKQKLKVTNSVARSERDIIVNSKIDDPAPGDPLADTVFHWRVYRNRDGAMAIVDAGADNVWLAIEQRGQFTSVIANNGGGEAGIDALLAQLREQLGG
ncbi:MAG: MlaC/ttg2D family ABC transporter substrate-binding protein [Hyphococcus sp.]